MGLSTYLFRPRPRLAAVSRSHGVPQASLPSLAPVSGALLTPQTAPLRKILPSELVFKELMHCDPKLYCDPPLVQADNSSGSLGGNIATASSSLRVKSPDITMDSSALMSFPATVSADNRGSVLPDALDTGDALERYRQVSQKMEALIAKDGKDGEIQSIIAEVHDILIKCVNRDEAALAVAQKVFKSLYYNTSNSGSMMWYVATLVAIRDVCKLLVKELTNWVICLDDEKKFNIEIMFSLIRSDLLNVGEYNVHLAKLIDGGRHKVATEFAMSLVQALINQDSVSISELYDVVDALSKISRRPGSPESFQQLIDIARSNANNASGFALGKDEKVVQSKDKKISANSSAVGRCSWKSSSMGMLKFSTRLQPRHYRPVTVRCTPSKKLRKAVKKLNAKLFQSNALQRYKERIELLQQELKNSTKLIIEEKSEISLIHDVQKSRPSSPSEKFDKIMSMDKVCQENDKLLKKLQMSLLLNFDGTDLLSKVEDIHTQNKTTSKLASRLAGRVYDYRARMDVELSWFSHFVKIKQVFSSKFAAIISEIDDFLKSLVEMSQSIDEIAPWNHSQDYELQLCVLRTVFIIWESTNISIKYAAFLLELAADCCSQSKNWRNIYSEKTVLAERFHHAELDVKQNGPQLERHISIIQPKVEDANRLYVMKLVRHLSLEICFNIVLSRMIYWGNSWPSSMCIAAARVLSLVWLCHWHEQISYTPSHIFQTVLEDSFSWRFRKFNNRNIAPSIRTQGRGECSSVATISATESLHKKKSAARFTLRDEVFQGEEFIIKLSHNQLQDIVAQIFEKKQQEGKNKLHVCLEQMEKKGVMSESAYNHGAAEVEDSHRYRINGFQEIKETGFDESCNILWQGNVLIGNMPITTDYFSLGPDDIYHIPPNAIYETNSSGQMCSHCVVIVGFGIAPDGSSYYVFQNSYGPNWGSGGYGRVSSASLKYLYSPTLA